MGGELAIFARSGGRVGDVVDEKAVMGIGELLRGLVGDFG